MFTTIMHNVRWNPDTQEVSFVSFAGDGLDLLDGLADAIEAITDAYEKAKEQFGVYNEFEEGYTFDGKQWRESVDSDYELD